jgi:hypothetical protein
MTLPRDSRVKLIVSYDIPPEVQQAYYEFVLREFIPQVQELGLAITEAWHTAYGDYPARMTTFVAPDLQSLREALDSEVWGRLKQQLEKYVTNPRYKIVHYKEGFQF